MGKHMDSIVVDNEKVAQDCIQYLRTEHIGIATFIPLDSVSVSEINERYRYGSYLLLSSQMAATLAEPLSWSSMSLTSTHSSRYEFFKKKLFP